MINIPQLNRKDVGKWMEYRGLGGEHERGRIKSWNDEFIFVVYRCDNQWHRFQDFTGAATNPEDLIFLPELEKLKFDALIIDDVEEDCPICHGAGATTEHHDPCSECGGSGKVGGGR